MNRKQWAWVLIDVGNSGFATTIISAVFPVYLPTLLPPEGVQLSLFGHTWQSSALSLWAYTVSGSVFVTFILSPFLGAWADEGGYRKRIFAFFTFMGIIGTLCLAFTQAWQLALLAFVVANVGFTASNVFYNSLLSTVAAGEHERNRISLNGFAWGYIGGGVLLAINLLMIKKFEWFGFESKTQGLEYSFISVAIWWLIFTLPSLFILKENINTSFAQLSFGVKHYLKQIGATLKSLPANRTLLLFMVSFAFFNEGIQTVISMSTIFGKQVIQLKEETLIGTLLLVQILGLPFTLSMNAVTKRFGAKRVLTSSLLFWIVIVTYAHWMTESAEFWALGVMVSIVLGVSQALPRSIFASLVPEHRQAEYFSFFALSGKMTSIMGPLTFGLVEDLTHNSRLSILSLGVFFILGLIFFSFVSIDPQKEAQIQ